MTDTSNNPDGNENEQAYDLFVRNNSDDVTLQGKYVVFVNGKLEETGDSKIELIKKMYDKHGNIEMYVGRTSGEKDKCIIDTPEFV